MTYKDLTAWKESMNLVEACYGVTPYMNHVSIALGSHGELVTCLDLAVRLGYFTSRDLERLQPQTDLVGKLLYGLHRALDAKRG